MKRISLLAVVVAASLLGALALATASASATVLCKRATALNNCGYEWTWPKETAIKATLAPGTQVKLGWGSLGLGEYLTCNQSEFGVVTANAGALNEDVTHKVTNVSFGECKQHFDVVFLGGGGIKWSEGGKGTFWSYSRIKLYSDTSPINATCTYLVLFGPAILTGGASPTLQYKNTTAALQEGQESCPSKLGYTATYNVTSPSPLYVQNS
jgi:hypothetical protein